LPEVCGWNCQGSVGYFMLKLAIFSW
jgi:hypothetical protein